MIKEASFSECGKYRFWLYRCWNELLPSLMLIGLNPSTANAEDDDPTIESIIRIATHNGFGAITMTNLFAQITPYPKELDYDVIHLERNDEILKSNAKVSDSICFCWGAFKVHGRDQDMFKMFPGALCLGKNQGGSPRHPLFMKGNTKLIKY